MICLLCSATLLCAPCVVALEWAAVAVLCLSAKEAAAWLKANPPRTVNSKAIAAGRLLVERPAEAAQGHLRRLDIAANVCLFKPELVIELEGDLIRWPIEQAPKVVARLIMCTTRDAALAALKEMSE